MTRRPPDPGQAGASGPIDFAGLADALLQRAHQLVPQWLPAGIERQGRWYCGDFDGGEGESANVSLTSGTWIDNGGGGDDRGGDLISLYARIHGLRNSDAARQLIEQLGWEKHRAAAPIRSASFVAGSTGAASTGTDPADDGPQAAAATHSPKRRKSHWRAIVPVPPHAPAPLLVWRFHDDKAGVWREMGPSKSWEYRFEGDLYGHVARYNRINSHGEAVKDVLPWTWCVDECDDRGHSRWHAKQWDAPRPLYVPATLLSGDLSLPVVVVEGEKCAAAGHRLLGHEFDFVSWPGGCKTWQLAAWGWLMGRTVYLWPDCDAQRERLTKAEREGDVDPATKPIKPAHDQPGMVAMVGIGRLLQLEQGCTAHLVQIPEPGAKPDGWDIADAIADGWDAARVRDFIRAAVPFQIILDAYEQATRPPSASGSAGGSAGRSTGSPPPNGGNGAGDGSPPDDDVDRGWLAHVLYTDKGAIKACRENYVLALDGLPDKGVHGSPETEGLIVFNEFSNNVEKTRPTPWGSPAGEWLEADELQMGEWLCHGHCRMPSASRETLIEATLIVAHRHRIHPVSDRYQALRGQWDGSKRLATWIRRTCLEEDEWDDAAPLQQYLSRVGTWLVMGMVARIFTPGCKFDFMPVFEGPGGYRKSTLAALLGGDHFADTGLILGDKDSYQNLQGISVYEWSELDSLNRAEVSKVKSFISSVNDRFRASFDRRPRDYPRQCVFVGTTNEAHYLTDMTGNRRFWPVNVTRIIDTDWIGQNLDQLVAEAIVYIDAGERMWPTPAEQRNLFDPQQSARLVESAIESSIRAYLYDENQKVPHAGHNGALLDTVSMDQLLTAIGYSVDKKTDVVVKRASSVLHALGWEVRRTNLPGRPRVYVRPPRPLRQVEGFDLAGAGGDPRQPAAAHGDTQGPVDDCPF